MIFYKILIFILFINIKLYSQLYVSDSDWDLHLNLKDVNHIVKYENSIYCFSSIGLYSLDLSDNSISRNLNALDLDDLSVRATAQDSNYFFLGTASGTIEIISGNKKKILNLSEDNSIININSISLFKNNLFISTSSGVFNVSLDGLFIKEVYRYFENDSEVKNIRKTIVNDSAIYALSDDKVYHFNFENRNPLDYNLWEEIYFQDDHPVGIFEFNNIIYYYSKTNIYNLEKKIFFSSIDRQIKKVKEYSGKIYVLTTDQLNNDHLGFVEDGKIIGYSIPAEINQITDFLVFNNELWISSLGDGLFNLDNMISFSPNNSVASTFHNLVNYENTIFGLSDSDIISEREGNLEWRNKKVNSFSEMTSATIYDDKLYISSKKDGIINYTDNKLINDLTPNSLLEKINENDIYISDLKSMNNKLWILNYGVENPLLSFDGDSEWMRYNINYLSNSFPKSFEFINENIWIISESPNIGILIYNMVSEDTDILSVNNGRLNSNSVNDIKMDLDGNIWIASDKGLIYYPESDLINSEYIIPNDGTNFLFRGIKINTVEVDYANNIWLGSNNGVFVFNNKKNKILYHFNQDSSPILSDSVLSIKSNQIGVMYILTNLGLQSINTSITRPEINTDNINFYPNPLKLLEHDRLYFAGLPSPTKVRITSIGGDLIYETKSSGGGFSWNLLSETGSKIQPGIFLIFITQEDGEEYLIGKILVL